MGKSAQAALSATSASMPTVPVLLTVMTQDSSAPAQKGSNTTQLRANGSHKPEVNTRINASRHQHCLVSLPSAASKLPTSLRTAHVAHTCSVWSCACVLVNDSLQHCNPLRCYLQNIGLCRHHKLPGGSEVCLEGPGSALKGHLVKSEDSSACGILPYCQVYGLYIQSTFTDKALGQLVEGGIGRTYASDVKLTGIDLCAQEKHSMISTCELRVLEVCSAYVTYVLLLVRCGTQTCNTAGRRTLTLPNIKQLVFERP